MLEHVEEEDGLNAPCCELVGVTGRCRTYGLCLVSMIPAPTAAVLCRKVRRVAMVAFLVDCALARAVGCARGLRDGRDTTRGARARPCAHWGPRDRRHPPEHLRAEAAEHGFATRTMPGESLRDAAYLYAGSLEAPDAGLSHALRRSSVTTGTRR